MNNEIIQELSKLGLIIGAIWALIQFWSANEFKKAQYLGELWRRFYTNEKYVEIFDLMDRDDIENFKNISSKELFGYLAFLEEIIVFRRTRFYQIYRLRDDNLVNLFQYHFYNLYIDEASKTQNEFWNKIVSNSDEVGNTKKEKHNFYWKLQYKFAMECAKSIKKQ